MARVSYIEENDHPELADLIGKIRAGRRGALINVYKLLLHSPALAAIWLEFVSAARFKVDLEGGCARSSSSASPISTAPLTSSSSTCRSSRRRKA